MSIDGGTDLKTGQDVTDATVLDQNGGQSPGKRTGFLILGVTLLLLVFLTVMTLMCLYIRRVRARMSNLNQQSKDARVTTRNYSHENQAYRQDRNVENINQNARDPFCVVKDVNPNKNGLRKKPSNVEKPEISQKSEKPGAHRTDSHRLATRRDSARHLAKPHSSTAIDMELNDEQDKFEKVDIVDEVYAKPIKDRHTDRNRQKSDREPNDDKTDRKSHHAEQDADRKSDKQPTKSKRSDKYKHNPSKEFKEDDVINRKLFRTRPGSARLIADIKREQLKASKEFNRRGSADDIEVVHTMDSYDQDVESPYPNQSADIGLVIGSSFDFLDNEPDTFREGDATQFNTEFNRQGPVDDDDDNKVVDNDDEKEYHQNDQVSQDPEPEKHIPERLVNRRHSSIRRKQASEEVNNQELKQNIINDDVDVDDDVDETVNRIVKEYLNEETHELQNEEITHGLSSNRDKDNSRNKHDDNSRNKHDDNSRNRHDDNSRNKHEDNSRNTDNSKNHSKSKHDKNKGEVRLQRRRRGETEEEWEERKKKKDKERKTRNETPEEKEERRKLRRETETEEERRERHRKYHERRRRQKERDRKGSHRRHGNSRKHSNKHSNQLSTLKETLSEEKHEMLHEMSKTNRIKVAEYDDDDDDGNDKEENQINHKEHLETSEWETSECSDEEERIGPIEMLV